MTRTSNQPLSSYITYPLLLVILLAGLTLRVWNINFDRGIGSHPDERSTACSYAPQIHLPASWDEFWDAHRSPLNPLWSVQEQRRRSFTYGHFPLYLGVAFGNVLHDSAPLAERIGLPASWTTLMARASQACDAIAVAGRLVIAGLDTLTILLLYWLARRIYGRGAGLLAAAFYAFTAQAVQLSHFFAMDPASTTFTVLALVGAVLMVQTRTWRAVILTGIAAGLAIASKFSALPILAAPVVAGILIAWDGAQRRWQSTAEPITADGGRGQLVAILGPLLALLLAGVTFFVTSPYAVLDWQNFVQATLIEQGAMVRGIADMPFTRQYRNTTPYLYFIDQQLRWGMGWPLGVVAALGTIYAFGILLLGLYRFASGWLTLQFGRIPRDGLSDEAMALLVMWSWVLPYFAITGAFLAKFNRYMSPLLPFVLLFAVGLITRLWHMARPHPTTDTAQAAGELDDHPITPSPHHPIPWARGLAILLAVVGVAGALFWATAYVNGVYNHEHTWITAARWLYQNAPAGSVVLAEQWDDPPRAVPNEAGMDMGSTGLRGIDWGPYEEDTEQKYEILKAKLREADFVWYSSKRIYDSVDELPERYPMTIRYYQAMWSGELGFELALDVTSPPRLFGLTFEDRKADESWSLYDHPQVTIFRKVRNLSDAEFDAIFARSWERAVPYYRGADSPLSPFLNVLGLGNRPENERSGLFSAFVGVLSKQEGAPAQVASDRTSLWLAQPLADLPVVDNYRWNRAASESPALAVIWWWLVLMLLGWAAWPLVFYLFRPLRDRGYLLSRTVGWLLAGWLLWWLASNQLAMNSVANAWLTVVAFVLIGAAAAVWQWRELWAFVRTRWPMLLAGEGLFAIAYLFFIWIRMRNPDLWQPWFGGEKFMEFAFLNGILRSPFFPPVDPHFAGGYINYYYFGIYLVAYLIKLTGIYAEVAFNLAIPTLFALTAVNAFAVAYSAVGSRIRDTGFRIQKLESGGAGVQGGGPSTSSVDGAEEPASVHDEAESAVHPEDADDHETTIATPHSGAPFGPRIPHSALPWRVGFGTALLAPLLVTLIGNLDGFAQLVRNLAQAGSSGFSSTFGVVQTVAAAASGLSNVLSGAQTLPTYDFWGPSRVIPETINEFPYWSFLFADLHAHVIGIPLAVLFLALTYTLISEFTLSWRENWPRVVAFLLSFGLLLGALASINLWELPTYFGVGVLALLISQVRRAGRINWLLTLAAAVLYLALAYLLFLPFFRHYVGVGASGVGLVATGDELGRWLLIWGLFVFILFSWLLYAGSRPLHRVRINFAARPQGRPPTWLFRPAPVGIVFSPGGLGTTFDEPYPASADESTGEPIAPLASTQPLGGERWLSQVLRHFDRLPRLIYVQRLLVTRPTLGYLLPQVVVGLSLLAAVAAWWAGRTVLGLCLAPMGIAVVLLWRRSREADAATLFVALATATGLAILAGTQLIFLKDFLAGGSYYRMNTLFKFFSQVWVLWGVAAAIALSQIWRGWLMRPARPGWWRALWGMLMMLLLVASLAYPVYGTPARLEMRMVGWRPPIGTLNGMDYMRQGSYTWRGRTLAGQELPETTFELQYDWSAIQWLLDHVRGNVVIVESAERDYYRAGGTRVASMTGLSGLAGMHEGEQRYGEDLGPRDALYREFWSTPDATRMQQILSDLQVALVYAGQLERYQHPDAVARLAQMAAQGQLTPVYENEETTIYAVPGRLVQDAEGVYWPQA